MKSKFFVGIPEFNIKTLMSFIGEITHRNLKTQDRYVDFINEIFSDGETDIVKDGNISRQVRGEVSFVTRKTLAAPAEFEIREDIDFIAYILRLKNYFSMLCENEAELLHTEGCFEKYSAQKAMQILSLLEQYHTIAQKLFAKKQREILANLTVVVLSFFIYNGRDYCSDVEILYADPFVQKLREKNQQNKTAENHTIYPELYAKVMCNGQSMNLVQLVKATGNTPLYIKAEGGGGKTTSVLAAVNEMHMEDEAALYIDAKQLDSYSGTEKEYFLLNCIGNFFEQYKNSADTQADRYNMCDSLLAKECRQLVVFIDGINETRDRTSLVQQIRALCRLKNVKTVITSRYFSGRIASAVSPLQFELEMCDETLQLIQKYCPEKAEKYHGLDEATKQLLKTPMFFSLYCTETDIRSEINAATLLNASLERTLRQQTINYGNLAQFVLRAIMPRFAAQCCKEQPAMSFTRRQFADFVYSTDADADIYQCIEIIVTSGLVDTADSQNFYFSHENFRDFLWAYNVAEKIQKTADFDAQADILHMPSNSFALKCFAQLCGKWQIRRLINRRSAENMEQHIWHSRENAQITAALMECARILWDNHFGENETDLFCDKNLAECDFRHCQIRDVSFEGSLVDCRCFEVEGHTTAVWAIEKYKDKIYALDKNVLTCYTTQLEKQRSCTYNGGNTIVSSARSKNLLCAADKYGCVRLFDLDKMQQTETAFSLKGFCVTAKNNGFVIGGCDGKMYICDTQLNVENTVQCPDAKANVPVPIGCTPRAVVFGCGKGLYRYGVKENTVTELCRFDLDISKGTYINGAVVAVTSDGKGTSKIMVYCDGEIREENTISANSETSAFLSSINLNGARINDIAANDEYMAMVCNNGMLYLYSTQSGDISLADVICLQNISAQNPSLTVESCAFADNNTIVCGFTDRSLRLIDINPANREKGMVIKHIKGCNNGIRRLFCTEYGIAAAFYDRGGALLDKESLTLQDKFILSDSDWVWMGIQWGKDLLFATGSYVAAYSPTQHRVTGRTGFKNKVEALFVSDNGDLFVAAGPAVYRVSADNPENIQLVVRDKNSRRALCFAQKQNKLYIGFSSIAGHSACLKIIEDAHKVTDADKYTEKTWDYNDGWYRSLVFSADGQYLFCCGLKQKTENGSQNITAVYKVGKNQLKYAGALAANGGTTLAAINVGEKLAVSDADGIINVYSINDECSVLTPEKTIKISDNQLFSMLLHSENTVLACSLDGNIYKIDTKTDKVQIIYTNTAGMYCIDCDFDGEVFTVS